VEVCKSHFCVIFYVSRTSIGTRQGRVKTNENFELKWKNNKALESGVCDKLKVYLDNKMEAWKMPNSKAHGADFYLPANFNYFVPFDHHKYISSAY